VKTCSSHRLVALFCSLEIDVEFCYLELDVEFYYLELDVDVLDMEKQLKACKNMEVAVVVVTAQVLTMTKYEACIVVATVKD